MKEKKSPKFKLIYSQILLQNILGAIFFFSMNFIQLYVSLDISFRPDIEQVFEQKYILHIHFLQTLIGITRSNFCWVVQLLMVSYISVKHTKTNQPCPLFEIKFHYSLFFRLQKFHDYTLYLIFTHRNIYKAINVVYI